MTTSKKRVLLISNSTLHGGGYLDHAEATIRDFLGKRRRLLFVPHALLDRDAYAGQARERFEKMGYGLDSLHQAPDAREAVAQAEALFTGGGNTFRLLRALQELSLLEPIRRRVEEGMPYIGSSAGSVVSCPTIRTTNDMPIVEPAGFGALRLIPFQINAHYLDADPASTHMGETREERLRQFHEENPEPVVGLREGTMLRVEGDSVVLLGGRPARIFRRGKEPVEVPPGTALGEYLAP
ncbi:MAG TPA: dipeptidase PepE [Thermoanaerobaculia bacterium]|nr:dipeptidase PepE [Thermoanaerobaculia bacterium]